jgi:DNA-binding beta-propeller fold protein YncE
MKTIAAFLLLVLTGSGAAAAPCPCTTFFAGDAKPFIAEGLARDSASGRFFVAGVAARRIVEIRNGRARDFVRLPGDYSPFGIAVAKQRLWVTAGTVAQGAGHDGPSALIVFDLRGKVIGTYPVPEEGRHVLGDLAIASDGTVYVSDGLGGSIYMLPPRARALTRLGAAKLFKSPQGMALSADGQSLLVADYALGLTKLDLGTATFTPLKTPAGANVKGIDGLARLPDGSFLASQNGTRQPHILRLSLSTDWSELLSAAVIAADDPSVADPSLVLADKSGTYVVGVSQWGSFGEGQTPARPLQPWRIIKLDLN